MISPKSEYGSSERLRVFKYQSLGNSYLVLDPQDNREFAARRVERSNIPVLPSTELVRWLCDETRGIGSNGLLFGPINIPGSDHFGLCIINSDGTYAGFSGNGVRIFARYLLDAGYTRPGAAITAQILLDESIGVPRAVPIRLGRDDGASIDVTLPYAPRFGPEAVGADPSSVSSFFGGDAFTVPPLAKLGQSMTGSADAWKNSTFVDVGNPHCTTFVPKLAFLPSRQMLRAHDDVLRAIAYRSTDIGEARTFARGVNLQWACVLNRGSIKLVIYERGEGPTDASGSSACAAACAAFTRGAIDPAVEVNMPGGSLVVRIAVQAEKIASVTLSGWAARILEARVDRPVSLKVTS